MSPITPQHTHTNTHTRTHTPTHPQVLIFLEELASVVLTPFMLYFTLPQCAGGLAWHMYNHDFTGFTNAS